MESEETVAPTEEGNQVFSDIIKKVNELQARFPKPVIKEGSDMPSVNYSTSTAAESAFIDETDTPVSSTDLLHAFKQIERIDCVVAKNQEARRLEDALRKTIISEDVLTQACIQKNKVTEAVDHGQLLTGENCHDNKNVPIATKLAVKFGFDNTLKSEFDTDHCQPSNSLEKNSTNSNKTQDTQNVQEIKPSQHFIKRNIKLVTEGHRMGSLATITDEERMQLDRLLEDLEQHEQALSDGKEQRNRAFGDGAYSVSLEKMESIVEINSKLEKINEEKHSMGDRHCFDCASEEAGCGEAEVDEKRLWKGADATMNMKRRLNDINKILLGLNEPSKEVEPVDEAQIQELISEFSGKTTLHCSIDSNGTCDKLEGQEINDSLEAGNCDTAEDVEDGKSQDRQKLVLAEQVLHGDKLKEIIELTKCQMPCFKYRHQGNSSEN